MSMRNLLPYLSVDVYWSRESADPVVVEHCGKCARGDWTEISIGWEDRGRAVLAEEKR